MTINTPDTTNMEVRNKILYNNGRIVLAQIGKSFFKLKLEREIETLDELNGILTNNDVYLLTKGD